MVVVGGADFVASQIAAPELDAAVRDAGSVVVALALDGKRAGHLVMADALRSGTAGLLAGLRRLGIARILLATGDRRAVAEAVTEGLGLDAVRSDLTPDQKVLLVLSERKTGPVMMVGGRCQRRAGAGGRRHRRRDGRARGGRLGRGGRCRPAGRSPRSPAAGN